MITQIEQNLIFLVISGLLEGALRTQDYGECQVRVDDDDQDNDDPEDDDQDDDEQEDDDQDDNDQDDDDQELVECLLSELLR